MIILTATTLGLTAGLMRSAGVIAIVAMLIAEELVVRLYRKLGDRPAGAVPDAT